MKYRRRFLQVTCTGLLGLAGAMVQAEPGRFYIAPAVQWMDFDYPGLAGNDTGFSASLGLQMTERWSLELATFDLDPDSSAGGTMDIDHQRLDFFYQPAQFLGGWQPFVTGGVGSASFGDDNETIVTIGGGLKYQLSDNMEWRTAVRSFRHLGRDLEDGDVGVDTALVYYFGTGDTASPRPSRPEAPAAAVRAAEPVVDTDADGVPDAGDACPDTPANYAVDERGCPIAVEEVARVELLVNFAFDSAQVEAEYFDQIEEITTFMAQYPDVVAELEGHADSRGTEQYNQGLSERRALAVKQVMVERFGISGGRITARGFGESRPISSNDTAAGRADNRRVITIIIKTLQNYQPR